MKFCSQCRTPISKNGLVCNTCGERFMFSCSRRSPQELSSYIEEEFCEPLSLSLKKHYIKYVILSATILLILIFCMYFVFDFDLGLKPFDWFAKQVMASIIILAGVFGKNNLKLI